MNLTDKYLKGLKPKTAAYRIFEKGIDKGFGVKVTPAGSVSFFVQYSAGGKQRFYNLGRYPSVSLSEARDRCREARSLIDRGVDPQEQQETKYGTVSDLFEYYVTRMQSEGKRSWQEVQNDLNFNCTDILNLQANEIEPVHIRKILHQIIKRGSFVQANRVRSFLHRAFTLGIYHDNDPSSLSTNTVFQIKINPVAAIPKKTGAETPGERNLSFNEIKTLWLDDSIQEQFMMATRLLLIYGCRMREVCWARKEEFDFNSMIWSIPPERVKAKRWHLLPITPLAKECIDRLWLYSRESAYLFPGRNNESAPIHKTTLCNALRRVKNMEPFTPRDLRRTVKTRMGEIGIEKSIRDRIQNHALNDVSSRHYDRYDYLPQKREALERWERHLIDLNN